MKGRKFLVLATCAVFAASVGSLGLYRALLTQKPVIILAKEYPSIGQDQAPVEIVVFEDLLCHTCRYFSMEVFPAIESTYVDRGVAKYSMVPLAFSSQSREMANAALAVYHQAPQYFFPFIRELFSRFSEKLDLNELIEIASQFRGIDLPVFEASVKAGRYDPQLEHNLHVANKAMKKNLRTPAVFINGYPLPGISFESISLRIDAILSGREGG